MAEDINTFSGIDIPISEVHTSILDQRPLKTEYTIVFEHYFYLSLKNDA